MKKLIHVKLSRKKRDGYCNIHLLSQQKWTRQKQTYSRKKPQVKRDKNKYTEQLCMLIVLSQGNKLEKYKFLLLL